MEELKGLLQNIYQMLDLFYHKCNPLISILHLIRAIARAHASTRTTSLMRVKNSLRHFCL